MRRWLAPLLVLVAALVMAAVASAQGMQFDNITPTPGTAVAPGFTLTVTITPYPTNATVRYSVLNSRNATVGQGVLPVAGRPGASGAASGPVNFAAAPNEQITVAVFVQSNANGTILGTVPMMYTVAGPPQQRITITSPADGTNVGSPLVLTGTTSLYPTNGTLYYRMRDTRMTDLANGQIQVQPAGQGSTWSAWFQWAIPQAGGVFVAEVYELGANGQVVAQDAVTLNAFPSQPGGQPTPAPQGQVIYIDTPPPGTMVGSPIVVTGRTARYPTNGQLTWRIRDTRMTDLASGTMPVTAAGFGSTWKLYADWNVPQAGGIVAVEILDIGPDGTVIAAETINLNTPAPGGPVMPPTPAPPPTTNAFITIDTPAQGTVVFSPFNFGGRTNAFPNGGPMYFRATNELGRELSSGTFNVQPTPPGGSPWNAYIQYPGAVYNGPVFVTVEARDAFGNVTARASTNFVLGK